ncbi:MAG: YidC/Oxa1 family insertase periplasmic domain-containing protein, partial [Rickettsiales bacterium]|nr:YidC/Oxa1 family insertase periplasmic domain-containing protein [Rickettsiales bacterium]
MTEKNITPGAPVANDNNNGKKKPDFLRIFLWTAIFYFSIRLLFAPKPATPPKPAEPVVVKEIARILVPFETPRLKGNFNAVGLRIDDVTLKGYKETRAEDSSDVRLLSYAKPDDLSRAEYAEFGLLADNADIPTKESKWSVISSSPTEIKLAWTNRDKVNFERKLNFDDGY